MFNGSGKTSSDRIRILTVFRSPVWSNGRQEGGLHMPGQPLGCKNITTTFSEDRGGVFGPQRMGFII